ncbi:MAG: tat pathway signal sequence [Mycobacteriaceae bacterium]|nr:tat pathway signal sequence [Mycobacteriaceae bacterium]
MVNGLSCDLRMRITTVDNYLRTRPGVVGYVVRDRVSGGSYANGNANAPIWTASTIKLATAADLLTRNRSGALHLSGGDYADIDRMLHTSDDDAADRLWFAYAGPDHLAFNNAFRGFGMTGLVPQAGFTRFYPYWGFQKCSAADLDRLMTHVLTGLHPDDRNYLVTRMRTVDANQQWGVWGAGPAQRPGLKDGWSEEQGGWVVNSVGFVGPGERYTLAIMNSLNGQGQFKDGAATDTQVAKLLFNGLS